MADLLAALQERAFAVAAAKGVTVTASSNVLPSPVTLYDARDSRPSLLDVLGIRVHVVARTADGKELAEYGEPVTFSPLIAAVYGSVIVLGVIAFGATVSRLLR